MEESPKGTPEQPLWSQRILEGRTSRGWGRAKLAEKLEVDPRTITRWEEKGSFPNADQREALMGLFGKSAEELGFKQELDRRSNPSSSVGSPSLHEEPADVRAQPAGGLEAPSAVVPQNLPPRTPQHRPIGGRRPLLTGILVLLIVVLASGGGAYVLNRNGINPLTLVSGRQQTSGAPATLPVPASTPTASPTLAARPGFAYDFEGTTTGWDSSYQSYNPAFKLGISTEQAYSGQHSLKVTTRFLGDATAAYQGLPDPDAKNVYTYSDAKVYFTQEPPAGFSGAGPFNFSGKQFSCFAYFPQWLLSGGEGKVQVELFAKNRLPGGNEPNIYNPAVVIDHSMVQKWVKLTLNFGTGPGSLGFDPTQVAAIGVRLTVLHGSTIEQTGSYYIDACTLPR